MHALIDYALLQIQTLGLTLQLSPEPRLIH
jgi:hypothetical protein